jgi:predicted TIM-barrel fold metal-dependent hydrolase
MNADDVSIVDSHIHWWDPGNEWMLMATQEQADGLGMGDISGMIRPYLPTDYRADTDGYRVVKVVWVMATLDPAGHQEELDWAHHVGGNDPLLGAMIASVDPSLSKQQRADALAAQARHEQFRGVRVIGELPYGTTTADEYMRMLADGGFVYDHMGHHQTMRDAGRLAERHPDVPWVLEHCGWPQHPADPADVRAWREGIRALAAAGNVNCKLSGLAMSVHAFSDGQRPFLEYCLESFGTNRCMFGSNFPVDRVYGSFDELMRLYVELTRDMTAEDRRKLFSGTAQRIYGI